MKRFRVMPSLYEYDTLAEFCEEFQIGKNDLIVTNPGYFEPYFPQNKEVAGIIYVRNYGIGEPTDETVNKIYADICNIKFDRIIGIGGGSILDIAKILILKDPSPVIRLYEKKQEIVKDKQLVLIPTTCGTGSEVTNVSVLNVLSKGTKMGLQEDAEFADAAVLVVELLENIPFHVFATSSMDAFIHASESFLSPKASAFSKMFSKQAIEMIIQGYKRIVAEGKNLKKDQLEQFLLASSYAGIAFGNAGCAAVHAMSMPFSTKHHVAHGEANYVLFQSVFETYIQLKPDGDIKDYLNILAENIGCDPADAMKELEKIFSYILERKPLREYGVKEEELEAFIQTVLDKQQRLTVNNYTNLEQNIMLNIYRSTL